MALRFPVSLTASLLASVSWSVVGCTTDSATEQAAGGASGVGAGTTAGTTSAASGASGSVGSSGASEPANAGSSTGGTSGVSGSGNASGAGGTEASAGSDSMGGTSTGGQAEGGSPSGCAPGKYIICEDFEATADGEVPEGWEASGEAAVAVDEAAHGTHSLRIEAAPNGQRRIHTDATALGSAHWGRVFYKVQLPVPGVFVHSTLVAFQGVGPTRGDEEVRVVDTVKNADGPHQFLYNVQPNGPEFGTGSSYDWEFDGMWHCAEWHIDADAQSYHFYFDGDEVTQIALDNGAGNYDGTDIPSLFTDLRVGWNNYQNAAPGFVAWFDDVALGSERIGCDE